MLIPLTREKFEQIVPLIATGPQYAHHWKNVQNFLKQLLISVVAVVVMLILGSLLGDGGKSLTLILCLSAGLYWLWGPVYWASLRNAAYRRYPYSGFLRGQVLDVYLTEELVSEEETVNKRGELVIIENRERRINLEVGDETGFRATVQAPLRRIHKAVAPGQVAELVVLSQQPELAPIDKITDVYIPQHNLWIGEYPLLQRDIFAEVSRQLGGPTQRSPRRRASEIRRRTRS
ncbi:MAG: phosphate ABC transporter permease [Cyanophyceae cyanobacterium]